MDIKIVVNIKGDRATIGVQSPDTDPVLEIIAIANQEDALQEAFVAATDLVERAQQRWAASPKDPAYHRPPPPPAPAGAAPAPRPATPARAPAATAQEHMF